ncbi:hypothetical protein VPH35_072929 [Triticum aestivum]
MRKPQEEASPHCEEAAEGGTQLCVAGRRRRRGADANQGGVSTRLRGWKGCAGKFGLFSYLSESCILYGSILLGLVVNFFAEPYWEQRIPSLLPEHKAWEEVNLLVLH